jgi:hypothetical protein
LFDGLSVMGLPEGKLNMGFSGFNVFWVS